MLDKLEARILDELSKNAKRARKRIAESVDISESYLSKKIDELVSSRGVIKNFTIKIDYEKIGYGTDAITLIKAKNIASDQLNDLAKNIATLDDAIEVFTIFGDWDIYVRWKSRSPRAIMDQMNAILHAVNVSDSVTITFGNEIKSVAGPALATAYGNENP